MNYFSSYDSLGNFSYTEEIYQESDGRESKRLVLEGRFQEADVPNRNNRVYPEGILRREVDRLQQVLAKDGPIPMSADHPIVGDDKASQSLAQRVGVDGAAGLLTGVRMEGKSVIGKCVVLKNSSKGRDIAALIENGWIPKVSSRGVGGNPQMNDRGYMVIPEDYKLLCWDFVSTPSVETAVLKRINEEYQYFAEQAKQQGKANLSEVLDKIFKK